MPTFIILYILLLVLFLLIRKHESPLEFLPSVLYGWLGIMAWTGMFSVLAAYLQIPLSYDTLNLWMLFGIVLCGTVILYSRRFGSYRFQEYTFSKQVAYAYGITVFITVLAGLAFFSVNLVPSSMTGDPPRHYLGLLNLDTTTPGIQFKPIYYISCGILTEMLQQFLLRDQAFVLSNILYFSLSALSAITLMSNVSSNVSKLGVTTGALLIALGYGFIALQYGYYTLLTSSAYSFAILSLILARRSPLHTGWSGVLIVLLTAGLGLTHAYLLPEIDLIVAASILMVSSKTWNSIRDLFGPSIFLLVLAAISWISFVPFETALPHVVNAYQKIIIADGYVIRGTFIHIVPLIPFTVIYLASRKCQQSTPTLAVVSSIAALFTAGMYVLVLAGQAAPYYANRNLILLMPLMIIMTVLGAEDIAESSTTARRLILLSFCAFAVIPYLYGTWMPLCKSPESYLKLKESGMNIYFQAAENTKRSPLQMTARDRTLLKGIGSDLKKRTVSRIRTLPALGTDHELGWIQIYSGIPTSYSERHDGFLDAGVASISYTVWKLDPAQRYILVVNHLNYTIPGKIIRDVKIRSHPIVTGDSFTIYEKDRAGH